MSQSTNNDIIEAMPSVYFEFYRMRTSDDITLRDMLYLDGVLSVLDSRNFPAIIERETGRKLQDIMEERSKSHTPQPSTKVE